MPIDEPTGKDVFPSCVRKPPFPLSSKPGGNTHQSFLDNETRYFSLTRKFPNRSADLFAKSETAVQARFDHL